MRIADVEEDIDHELVSREQIDAKIHEVAARVSDDYRGKDPLLVAVLKGAVNTLVEFSQAMSIRVAGRGAETSWHRLRGGVCSAEQAFPPRGGRGCEVRRL